MSSVNSSLSRLTSTPASSVWRARPVAKSNVSSAWLPSHFCRSSSMGSVRATIVVKPGIGNAPTISVPSESHLRSV